MSVPYEDPELPFGMNLSSDDMRNASFGMVVTIWGQSPPFEIAWKGFIVFIICLVGLVGNFLVIFLVLRQPKIRQQPVNIYIVNLAIADFLTVLFTPTVALVNNVFQNYELGPVMCKLEILLKMMCILSSVFSIIAISFQRFLNINHPSSTQYAKSTHQRTLFIIIMIWIVAIVLALPLAIWRTYQERQWKDYLEKWCTENPAEASIKYWIIVISPLIYIPLIVMIIMYSLMIVKINRFIGKVQQATGLSTSIRDSSSYVNSNGSTLKEMEELRKMQAKHKKKMQQRRKKQRRAKTEPAQQQEHSMNHSYISYDDPSEDHRFPRRSSSVSYSTSSAMPITLQDEYEFSSSPMPTFGHGNGHVLYGRGSSPPPSAKNVHTLTYQPNHSALPNHVHHSSSQPNLNQLSTNTPPMHQLFITDSNRYGGGGVDTCGDVDYDESVAMGLNGLTHLEHSQPVQSPSQQAHNSVSNNNKDGASQLQQQLAHRQAMSANVHKRSIMFTIIIYCLITFCLWLPLQFLVYYRAFKSRQTTLGCWYEKTKFLAHILCSVNSAINPFITFRKTFSMIYQQFRAKQKQQQLRKKLKKNQLKLMDPSPRKPIPSMVETMTMSPIVQVIEIIQQHGKEKEEEGDNRNSGQHEESPYYHRKTSSKSRRRKVSKSKEDSDDHVVVRISNGTNGFGPTAYWSKEADSNPSNGHIAQAVPKTKREQNNSLKSPSLDGVSISSVAQAIVSAKASPLVQRLRLSSLPTGNNNKPRSGTTLSAKADQQHKQAQSDKPGDKATDQATNNTDMSNSASVYTHNLTKQVLMKYTPEIFVDEQ